MELGHSAAQGGDCFRKERPGLEHPWERLHSLLGRTIPLALTLWSQRQVPEGQPETPLGGFLGPSGDDSGTGQAPRFFFFTSLCPVSPAPHTSRLKGGLDRCGSPRLSLWVRGGGAGVAWGQLYLGNPLFFLCRGSQLHLFCTELLPLAGNDLHLLPEGLAAPEQPCHGCLHPEPVPFPLLPSEMPQTLPTMSHQPPIFLTSSFASWTFCICFNSFFLSWR